VRGEFDGVRGRPWDWEGTFGRGAWILVPLTNKRYRCLAGAGTSCLRTWRGPNHLGDPFHEEGFRSEKEKRKVDGSRIGEPRSPCQDRLGHRNRHKSDDGRTSDDDKKLTSHSLQAQGVGSIPRETHSDRVFFEKSEHGWTRRDQSWIPGSVVT